MDHLKVQDIPVKILPPFLTSVAGCSWRVGDKSFLMVVTDKLNEIIEHFLGSGASHLFFVNADIEVPQDGLHRLFMMDVDVASGVYPFHDNQDYMMAGTLNEKTPVSYTKFKREEIKGKILGEKHKVAAGDGCLLIKKRVVQWASRYYEPLRFRCHKGEASDLRFFYDAQTRGFTTRINGNVICGHLPQFPLEE